MNESVEQSDITEGLTTEVIGKQVKKGIAVLTMRTFLMQAISFSSNALLTVFLLPAEYGVFFLVSAVVNFLAYFSDIGFAASLIQKKDELKENDLRSVFTAQQILVVALVLIVVLSTPIIQSFYHFNSDVIYLLWALAFSLLFSSLKTIPSVLLERRLEFHKLVIPQIVETIVFSLTAVYFAWQGFGVTSFTIAILLRGITGLVVMFIICPWMPVFSFSLKSFLPLLKFGIPYQANTFLAMVKDDGMIIFLGSILGPQGIGLLGWSQKWAYAPLRFFMDQVIKVTFPAFSRLQNNKEELSKAVSSSIKFVCFLVFPSLVMLVITAPVLIQIIPKYNKWENALPALSILCITSALAAVTTPLTNTLNAIGKISLTFKLMIMWTILTWVLVPALSIIYGLNGAAAGLTLVGLSSLIAINLIRKYITINFLESVGKPLLVSFIVGISVFFVRNLFEPSVIQFSLMVVIGIITYIIAISVVDPSVFKMLKFWLKKIRVNE